MRKMRIEARSRLGRKPLYWPYRSSRHGVQLLMVARIGRTRAEINEDRTWAGDGPSQPFIVGQSFGVTAHLSDSRVETLPLLIEPSLAVLSEPTEQVQSERRQARIVLHRQVERLEDACTPPAKMA